MSTDRVNWTQQRLIDHRNWTNTEGNGANKVTVLSLCPRNQLSGFSAMLENPGEENVPSVRMRHLPPIWQVSFLTLHPKHTLSSKTTHQPFAGGKRKNARNSAFVRRTPMWVTDELICIAPDQMLVCTGKFGSSPSKQICHPYLSPMNTYGNRQ